MLSGHLRVIVIIVTITVIILPVGVSMIMFVTSVVVVVVMFCEAFVKFMPLGVICGKMLYRARKLH